MKKIILLICIIGFVAFSCNKEELPNPEIDVELSTDNSGDDDEEPIIET